MYRIKRIKTSEKNHKRKILKKNNEKNKENQEKRIHSSRYLLQ